MSRAPTDLCPGDSGYAVHAESGELLLGEGGDKVRVLSRVQERVQGSLISAAKEPTFLAVLRICIRMNPSNF
jgi:hypothetical protein